MELSTWFFFHIVSLENNAFLFTTLSTKLLYKPACWTQNDTVTFESENDYSFDKLDKI